MTAPPNQPSEPAAPKAAPRKRAPRKPAARDADTIPPDRIEILPPPRRGLVLDWRRLAPTIALGTATGFVASLSVGGGGLLRHVVVGLLGMLVGQGIVRSTGWKVQTGHDVLDEAAMAVIGAVLVVLLARFIA